MTQIEKKQKQSEEGFYFEIIDLEKEGSGQVERREGIFEKLTQNVSDKIFSFIPTLANSIQQNINKCENKPKEINCEFSIVLGGKTKFFICEFSSEGQFKVNIKWVNPENKKTE